MKPLPELTDDEIDSLLILLFNGITVKTEQKVEIAKASDNELRRIRSKNHPDKWPHVDLSAYQAAVEELDRRRHHDSRAAGEK